MVSLKKLYCLKAYLKSCRPVNSGYYVNINKGTERKKKNVFLPVRIKCSSPYDNIIKKIKVYDTNKHCISNSFLCNYN